MTEHDLQNIITVYDEGSFLAASRKLFISQPALSQSIRKLERQLGTKLFTLEGNRIHPTRICKSIVAMGRPAILKWTAFQSDVDRLLTQKQIGLRVIAPGDILISIIFPSSDRFRLSYPDVNVTLSEMPMSSLYEHMENDTEDLSFVLRGEPVSKYQFTPVLTVEYYLAVPSSHPYALKHPFRGFHDMDTVDLKDFYKDPFVLPKHGHNSYDLFMHVFQEAGFLPNVGFEAATVSNLREYVYAGKALTFVTSYFARSHPHEKKACYYRINLSTANPTIYAVRSLNAQPSAIVDAFIKAVSACQADII